VGAKFGPGLHLRDVLYPLENEIISLSIAHEAHRSEKHHVPTKRSHAPISLAPTLV